MIVNEKSIDDHSNHKYENESTFISTSSKNSFDPSEFIDYDYSVHLDEVVKHILAFHPKDGLSNFEDISMYMKKKITKLSISHKAKMNKKQPLIDMNTEEKKIFSEINNKKLKQLPKIANCFDDVLEKSKILESVGISFGRNIWYKLKLSMKKLAIQENAESLKFFGKIYGLENDYYVVYGKLKNYPVKKYSKNPHFEPSGYEGINQYTFWVSNNIFEEWIQLPELNPLHIAQSMLFKYYFTGNLNAKVNSFIQFKGTEAHLLKCQVLRIMHACFVVPDGYLESKAIESSEETYGIELGDKCVQVKEDFVMPTSNEELLNAGKWVHEFAYIFPNGKIIEIDTDAVQVPRMRDISQDNRKNKLYI